MYAKGTPMPRDEERIALLAHDLELLFGAHWRGRVAGALDMHPQPVRRMFAPPKGRTDQPPEALYALVEFLKLVSPVRWPERWKKDH